MLTLVQHFLELSHLFLSFIWLRFEITKTFYSFDSATLCLNSSATGLDNLIVIISSYLYGFEVGFHKVYIYIYIYGSKTFIVFGFKCFFTLSDNVTKHFMAEKFTKG